MNDQTNIEAITALTVPEHALATINLFKIDHTLLDDQSRGQMLNQFDALQTSLIDEITPTFKRLKLTTTITRWTANLKALKAEVQDHSIPLNQTVQKANMFAAELHNHEAVLKHFNKKAERQAAIEEGDYWVDFISQYTYLVKTDGKLMVLTDNVKAAEVKGEPPHRGLAYTQLRHSDAMLELANIPYTVINGLGKETRGNVIKAWNESKTRKDLTGITFDPSTTDRVVNGKFNTWKGWAIEPVQGNDLPFWELTLDVLCNGNEEYFDFVQKYFAHMVQKPWERPLCAIGITGGQGIGKSAFVTLLGSLMHDAHYAANVPMKAVAGDQQGRDLEGVLLAYLDEASWGGDKLSTGALKKAITGEFDRINEKFVPAYNVPTYKRVIFSSNEEYYYHADADDRRLLPLEAPKNTPKKSDEFFAQLFDQSKGGTPRPELLSAMMHTLQNIELGDWTPHKALQKLKITTGSAMLERSMTNVQRWLYEAINNRCFESAPLEVGSLPHQIDGDAIAVYELQESYKFHTSHAALDRNRTVNLTSVESVEVLRKVFGHAAKQIKRHGQNTRRYLIDWPVMQANFSSMFKWEIKWDTQEHDPALPELMLQHRST